MAHLFSIRRKRKPPVRIQFISDLHLELGHYYTPPKLPAEAPFLVLAGDIGQLAEVFDSRHYLHFIRTQCENFQHVYLVLGNHEFYGVTRQAGVEIAMKLQAEPILQSKLTVLYRKRVDISEDVTLLGCTLNTHIPPDAYDSVLENLADFRKIEEWTIKQHNQEHDLDKEWLKNEMTSIQIHEPKRQVVIATHHAPSLQNTMNPLLKDKPWHSAFPTGILESESETWTQAPCLRYWIFGHTHWNSEIRIGNLVLCSNQKGYERNKGSEGGRLVPKLDPEAIRFDVRKMIEL